MHTLTEICKDHDLTPRCSTEPTNLAAQTVIRRAGFRTRHQIFKVSASTPSDHQSGSSRAPGNLGTERVSVAQIGR